MATYTLRVCVGTKERKKEREREREINSTKDGKNVDRLLEKISPFLCRVSANDPLIPNYLLLSLSHARTQHSSSYLDELERTLELLIYNIWRADSYYHITPSSLRV